MCRALFIQNEKADVIHRIPLTSSNQLSFPACTHLHPHHLPRYFTHYVSVRHAYFRTSDSTRHSNYFTTTLECFYSCKRRAAFRLRVPTAVRPRRYPECKMSYYVVVYVSRSDGRVRVCAWKASSYRYMTCQFKHHSHGGLLECNSAADRHGPWTNSTSFLRRGGRGGGGNIDAASLRAGRIVTSSLLCLSTRDTVQSGDYHHREESGEGKYLYRVSSNCRVPSRLAKQKKREGVRRSQARQGSVGVRTGRG